MNIHSVACDFNVTQKRCSHSPAITVVVPCYNEAEVLGMLYDRLLCELQRLGRKWEVILIDDGSNDDTLVQMAAMHRKDPRFKVIALSKNFGHQAAISAGLSHASGEAVAVLDADLQDPPELLGPCLQKLSAGFDVVYAVRRARKENWLKRLGYNVFYRILKILSKENIPLDTGDFCVMKRNVVDVMNSLSEQDAFLRGLRAWTGFRQIGLEYERDARAAGHTKYSFGKLVGLALDGLLSFSVLPLRVAVVFGLGVVVLALSWAGLHLIWRVEGFRLMGHTATELPGWTTLMCGMFFLGGLQLLVLGCVGEYIGRIFKQVKNRPRWIERATLGLIANESRIVLLNEVDSDRNQRQYPFKRDSMGPMHEKEAWGPPFESETMGKCTET